MNKSIISILISTFVSSCALSPQPVATTSPIQTSPPTQPTQHPVENIENINQRNSSMQNIKEQKGIFKIPGDCYTGAVKDTSINNSGSGFILTESKIIIIKEMDSLNILDKNKEFDGSIVTIDDEGDGLFIINPLVKFGLPRQDGIIKQIKKYNISNEGVKFPDLFISKVYISNITKGKGIILAQGRSSEDLYIIELNGFIPENKEGFQLIRKKSGTGVISSINQSGNGLLLFIGQDNQYHLKTVNNFIISENEQILGELINYQGVDLKINSSGNGLLYLEEKKTVKVSNRKLILRKIVNYVITSEQEILEESRDSNIYFYSNLNNKGNGFIGWLNSVSKEVFIKAINDYKFVTGSTSISSINMVEGFKGHISINDSDNGLILLSEYNQSLCKEIDGLKISDGKF